MRQDHGGNHAQQESQQAPTDGQGHGFHQELQQDVPPGGADRLAQSDFPCPFTNRYQHDIHDPDSTHQQRNTRNDAQKYLHGLAGLADGRLDFRHVPDPHQVFRVAGRTITARHLLGNFQLGLFHHRLAANLHIHIVDILLAHQPVHGRGQGNDDDIVHVTPLLPPLGWQHAHDGKRNPVDPDGFAHRIDPFKQFQQDGWPHQGHQGSGGIFLFCEKPPENRLRGPDIHVGGFNPEDLRVPVPPAPDNLAASAHIGRHAFYRGEFRQGLNILEFQAGHRAMFQRHPVHLAGTRKHHEQVRPHRHQLRPERIACSTRHRRHRDHRPHPDQDSQHREKSPRLVRPQGTHGLPDMAEYSRRFHRLHRPGRSGGNRDRAARTTPFVGHDPAIPHRDQAMGPRRDLLLVRDHHQGQSRGMQAFQHADNLHLSPRIQVAGGLIGHQHNRIVDQGTRNGHPLLFTAGQLVGTVPDPVGQSDRFQTMPGLFNGRSPAGIGHRQLDVFQGGKSGQ